MEVESKSILRTESAYAIMSLDKKITLVHEDKKNEPPKVLQYNRRFFFFYGEVNRLGQLPTTCRRLTT